MWSFFLGVKKPPSNWLKFVNSQSHACNLMFFKADTNNKMHQMTPWKAWQENYLFLFVPFCLRSLGPFERCNNTCSDNCWFFSLKGAKKNVSNWKRKDKLMNENWYWWIFTSLWQASQNYKIYWKWFWLLLLLLFWFIWKSEILIDTWLYEYYFSSGIKNARIHNLIFL